MVDFNIQFNKHDKTYKVGETIHLKIYISVVERFKVRKLYCRFYGAGSTYWVERNKVDDDYAQEEYFKHDVNLVGSDHGAEIEIKPGDYTYQASFTLPKDLPSSLDNTFVYIRYSVKLCYDIPMGLNKKFKEYFFVKSNLNLNDFPHLKEKVQTTTQKHFGFWFWKSEYPVQSTNILPKQGWIPGETIPITVEVDNKSDVRIEKIRVYLFEKLTFLTEPPCKAKRMEERRIKTHKINTPVEPYQNKVIEAQMLLDPNEEYTILNACNIISAEHCIVSFAKPAGCRFSLKNVSKIVIGTSPLIENESTLKNDVPSTSSAISPTAPFAEKNNGGSNLQRFPF